MSDEREGPPELEPPSGPVPATGPTAPEDPDIISAERTTPYERLVAISIVVGTLAAAVVGYLHVWSSGHADRTAAQAQRHAVASTGAEVRASLWTEVQFEAFSRGAAMERRAREAAVEAELFSPDDAARLELDVARFERIARRSKEFAELVGREFTQTQIEGDLAPQSDPSFPTRFMASRVFEPTRLAALQDAANQEGSGWQSRTASYTAVLTMFAVSLYLLGFSLALPPGLSRWFVRGGIAFISVGVVWAGLVSAGRPQEPSPRAAEAFAGGMVALSTAFDAYDNTGYVEATRLFSEAIEAYPTFARAYLARGQSVYFADSPNPFSGTVTSPEALDRAVADLELAEAYGLDSALIIGNIGALSFQQGLVRDDPAMLTKALEYTRRVIEIDPERPLWLYNEAVMLMALGRYEEAERAIDRGNEATLAQPSTSHIWTASAISAFDLLAQRRPEEAERVVTAKERVVRVFSTLAGAGPSTDEAVEPLEVRLDISPGNLQLVILPPSSASVDPATDVVVAEWYLDAGHGAAVITEASGGPIVLSPSVEGGWFNLVRFLPNVSPPRCVPNGTYRLELYVNGRAAGSTPIDIDFGAIRTVTDQDLNATFCMPSEWVEGELSEPGVVRDVRTAEGDAGMLIVRAPLPGGRAQRDLPALMDRLVDVFAGELGLSVQAQQGTTNFFFMGLTQPTQRLYSYPQGSLQAGIGIDPAEGAIVVAFVYGGVDDIDDLFGAFQSLNTFQPLPL